jgi:hypothetical protein
LVPSQGSMYPVIPPVCAVSGAGWLGLLRAAGLLPDQAPAPARPPPMAATISTASPVFRRRRRA